MAVSPNSGQTGCTTASIFMALALTLSKGRCTGYIRVAPDNAIENITGINPAEDSLQHTFSSMITNIKTSTTPTNVVRGYTWELYKNCDIIPQPEHTLSSAQVTEDLGIFLENSSASYNDIILDFGTDIDSELSKYCQQEVDKVVIVLNQNTTVIQNAKALKDVLISNIDKSKRRKLDLDSHFLFFINQYNPGVATYKEVAKKLKSPASGIMSLQYMPSIVKNNNTGGFVKLISHYWGTTIEDATIKNDIFRTSQVLRRDISDWKDR